ncbi:MAG: phosphoglycerate kinase, partial [Dehalococcoidia bacterium]
MKKKTMRDIDVAGKRVLVRVDYNVPLEPESGRVLDDTRIKATLPTLEYLREQGAKLILCSHLGRPSKGRDPALSLWHVAERLSELLGQSVKTAGCCCGPDVHEVAHALAPGEVLLLENLRFHPEEQANDPAYARALADLAELYVNDAFGAAHRAHASTVGVAAFLPAVTGSLMEKEIDFLSRAVA